MRGIGHIPVHLAALTLLAPIACGPSAAAVVPEVASPPPCSNQVLLGFDPGSEVLERRLLPAAEQETTQSQEHIVEVACEQDEDDDHCTARSAAQARGAFPGAKLSSALLHDRQLLQARFEVDGAVTEATFADRAQLLTHMAALQAAGKQVKLIWGEARPDPGSPRHAVTRATVVTPAKRRTMLRLELRTAPRDGDAVGALVSLQRRAVLAGLLLHTWAPEHDGALRVELGCSVQR